MKVSSGASRAALLAYVVASLLFVRLIVDAAPSCLTDADCVELLHPLSQCERTRDAETAVTGGRFISGYCTNPYASGCLRAALGKEGAFFSKRVCNSDDAPNSPHCVQPEFDYNEIRIGASNWESSMFLSFLMQIVLSELVGVPATIEAGPDKLLSFYDDQSGFPYPSKAYSFDELKIANEAPDGDCRLVDGPCVHVIPEVWDGQLGSIAAAQAEGYIEPAEGTSMVGKISWNVPAFLARKDPTLITHFGLSGEMNRRKLAETFKRPTTWEEYCTKVSPTGCIIPTDVSKRAPTPEEIEVGTGNKYRVAGVYTGYFRATDENNSDVNPNCTGHIIDCPCTWSTNLGQQAWWNDIALESNGPLEPNNGYSYGDMIDIWTAANETKSPVVMWWWKPDPTVQSWQGTDGAFIPVSLPEPTESCRKGRISSDDRCADDFSTRVGAEEGKCDDVAHTLRKVITASLAEQTFATAPAARSPGYDTIKNFAIDNLSIDTMLTAWMARGKDVWGFDPREAVCSWLAENIDDIASVTIPRGYPRDLVSNDWYGGLTYTAMAVAIISIILVVITSAFTFKYRNKNVIKQAQFDFLAMVLAGFLLVAFAALVYVIEPSTGSCVTKIFLVLIGYTLGIVPLLVKVMAINRMMQQAKKMKRVCLSRRQLYGAVAGVTGVITLYLVVWAAVDTPTREESLVLADEGSESVENQVECSSESDVWSLIAIAWQFILLLCTTVLAFQGRNIRQDFNESSNLAKLVYVHFLFLVFRTIMYFLWQSGAMDPTTQSAVNSLLLSLDTIASTCIYFGAKFYLLFKGAQGADEETEERGLGSDYWKSTYSQAESVCMARRSSLSSGQLGSVGERRLSQPLYGNSPAAIARRCSVSSLNSNGSRSNRGVARRQLSVTFATDECDEDESGSNKETDKTYEDPPAKNEEPLGDKDFSTS